MSQLNNVTHRYGCDGTDTLAIFIHGFAEGVGVFHSLIDVCLCSGVDVEALVLPGHGGSCRDFAETDGDQWLGYVIEAIERNAQSYKNIYLVGHSLGALLAILTHRVTDKVRGIVLLNAPLAVRVTPRAIATNLTIGLKLPIKPGSMAYAASQAMSVAPGLPWEYAGWIPRLRDLFRFIDAAKDALPDVSVPMLIFHSAKDELIGAKCLRLFRQLAPTALSTIVSLPQSTHFSYAPDDEAQITMRLLQFMR